MKKSRIISNLTAIGIGMGSFFPVFSILLDLHFKDLSLTIGNVFFLFKNNPMHWIILSAPFVLGFSFYYLSRKIALREIYLKELAEKEKRELKEIIDFVNELVKGNYLVSLSESINNQTIRESLQYLQCTLNEQRLESEKRNWINEGLAKFSGILRSHDNIEELSSKIIKNLVNYLKCNQGGLFLVVNDDSPVLELKGCYAFERKKYLQKKIEPGQGLVGQCYLEGERILLYEIPPDYIHITSGLGDASPNCIVIHPLKTENSIEGIIELASFKKFKDFELDFLDKVCTNIAMVIKSVKDADKTKKLLEATQQQTEMLRAQEEEMRQNMEELAATQEELQRKELEYIRKIEEYRVRLGESS